MTLKLAFAEKVEDKADLRRILRLHGIQTISFTPQTLEKMRKEGWDLLIVDVVMPRTRSTEDIIRQIVQIQEGIETSLPSPLPHATKAGKWQSVSLNEVVDGMGISRSTLAQILGTTERNLARWIRGETIPKGERDSALQKVKHIYYLLTRAFKKEVIPKYLREPNPSLGGRTPLMVLKSGDFGSVEADLLHLIEGVYV